MADAGLNVIADDFLHGENFKIGNFCIIEKGVNIGDNVTIGNYTMIQAGAKIDNQTTVGNFCSIGKNVHIGNNVTIKSYCEIRTNVKIGDKSSFGSRCTLCADTIIGENVNVKYGFVTTTMDFKEKKDLVAGAVASNSIIGANVILMPGASIGRNAVIGACSQVRSVVGDNEVWFGSPAKFYKLNDY